jgi:uncharacterized protein (TIGR03067 family)
MKRQDIAGALAGLLLVGAGALSAADETKERAIERDRKQIAGTWRMVELVVNGNRADEGKFTVVNGTDGTWTLLQEKTRLAHGTSTFDPTQTPKTIDFTLTEGDAKGETFLGIYELGEKTRKLCFAPSGKPRPTEFESRPGSEHILATFERQESE